MIKFKCHTTILTALLLVLTVTVQAHPTGNMITVGPYVLWSYINPVDDPKHHACVMIWEEGSEPKVFIQSYYAASDFMLYNNQSDIYIIERRYFQSTENFEIRILKATVDSEPKIIWNWFKDEWRIGEGGFFMISDDQIVFAMYPNIYTLKKGEIPIIYFEFDHPLKKIRAKENNQILLLGDNACFLVQQDGTALKQWDKLIDNEVRYAPLNLNQIFDSDYDNGELLLAYWGNRSFDIIDESGHRRTLVQQSDPLAPHWVAFSGNKLLLFSSELIFDGSTPKPHLVIYNNENEKLIWGK